MADQNEDSIFTRIIKGEIPSYKIYEDERTFAFLDIHPIQPGQALIIPKKQIEFVWDLDDADYQAVMATAKKVAAKMRQVFPDKKRIAMHIEGLDVAHAHIKVFPFDTDEEFRHHPDMSAEPDHSSLSAMAEKLKV
jgi:histidine triad (HIT) family protein